MISKNPVQQSINRKKIIIPDIYQKSKQKRRQSHKNYKEYEKSRLSMDSDEKIQKYQKNQRNNCKNNKNNKKEYNINEMIQDQSNEVEYYGDERVSNNNRKRVYNMSNQNNINNNNNIINNNNNEQFNNSRQYQHQHYKQIISRCTQCASRVQQFVTKKPSNRSYTNKIHSNSHSLPQLTCQSTQTIQKPFLIDLIQQRIQIICRKNTKLQQIIQSKQQQIIDKQQQLHQIQQKFTTIIYTLGQQLCYLKIKEKDQEEIKQILGGNNGIGNVTSIGVKVKNDTDVPAYLKMLVNDRKQ